VTVGTTNNLFVREWGEAGPALVLLHGLGASGQSWRLVADRLKDQARVICPDLLGFGRSPWPPAAYTVADHLAALDATLARLDLDPEPVLLAGHSTGAILAMEWAAAHPQRFRSVALISLPAYDNAEEARARIAALSPLAWATAAKPAVGELVCGIMCVARPFWRTAMPLLAPGVPADIARDYVLHDWVSYSNTLRNVIIDHRVAPAADRLAVTGLPVHLLHGENDRIAPLDAVRALAVRHGWPLRALPKAEHHLLTTHPAACATLLRMWAVGNPAS
jgi:pimeloyl-ACP methyl ester carboxylesterase